MDSPGLVHAEEGGRQPADVPLPLHEGGEGGDAVPDEVVGSSQDVQVHLGRVGLESHHLDLQRGPKQKLPEEGRKTNKRHESKSFPAAALEAMSASLTPGQQQG